MASVHVGPDDQQIVMRSSETILALRSAKHTHAYACGGRATMSICAYQSKRDSSSVAHVQKVSGL